FEEDGDVFAPRPGAGGGPRPRGPRGGAPPRGGAARPPRPARLLTGRRWIRRVPAYFIGYGALRERPPRAAVRRP
ncbi:hypothetical protein ACWDZX_38340, partial [Streptomyces collinus]